jgi:hypothetical protein
MTPSAYRESGAGAAGTPHPFARSQGDDGGDRG